MGQTQFYRDVRDQAVFSPDGPRPQVLLQEGNLRALVAALEPGQRLPPHPEGLAMYHFLEGTGWMIVDDQRYQVAPGATVFVRDGVRGVEAETRLIFLATRVA